ncbi:protein regulator of cytokinesis 1-like isoform X2 [Saccostrea cucullata]|uniref:protein regulator of cytokinesis 1-like isoform X2 n=1 Tax=Saccostrea cuccullata TaxID=36930 RepID=UPI002ED16E16
MPRRQAAQSAASKISNQENEEEPVSTKKSTRGRPGKPTGKPSRQQKPDTGNTLKGKENLNENCIYLEKSDELTNPEEKKVARKQKPVERRKISQKKGKDCSDGEQQANDQDSVVHVEDIGLVLKNENIDEEEQQKEETLEKRAGTRGRKKKVDDKSKIQQDETPDTEQSESGQKMELNKTANEQVKTTTDIDVPQKRRGRKKENNKETKSEQKDATFTVDDKAELQQEVEHNDNDTMVTKATKRKAKGQTRAIEPNKGSSKTKKLEEELLTVRSQISQWWEKCYFGAKQRKLFLPYFDDTLTASNLTAHKKEETRLRKYYEKNRAVFENISMHYSDDDLKQRLQGIEKDYQMKLFEKDKEFLDYQALQRELMKDLETQVQAKEQKIKQVEENIQEMKDQQSKLQTQAEQNMEQMKNEVKQTKELLLEKDELITALGKLLDKLKTNQVDQKSEQRENEFQEMKELLFKKDEIIKGLRKSLEEKTEKTCPREDNFIKTSERHCLQENVHEINVLHEFCQKQKTTIRTLQREIEHLRKIKNESSK